MVNQVHWQRPLHVQLDWGLIMVWLPVVNANTSAHDRRVQCCLGYTEAVELVGQRLSGLITATIRVLGVLVPAEAVHRTGLVLALKLGVGTSGENRTLVNICSVNTKSCSAWKPLESVHGCRKSGGPLPVQFFPFPVKPGLQVQV